MGTLGRPGAHRTAPPADWAACNHAWSCLRETQHSLSVSPCLQVAKKTYYWHYWKNQSVVKEYTGTIIPERLWWQVQWNLGMWPPWQSDHLTNWTTFWLSRLRFLIFRPPRQSDHLTNLTSFWPSQKRSNYQGSTVLWIIKKKKNKKKKKKKRFLLVRKEGNLFLLITDSQMIRIYLLITDTQSKRSDR